MQSLLLSWDGLTTVLAVFDFFSFLSALLFSFSARFTAFCSSVPEPDPEPPSSCTARTGKWDKTVLYLWVELSFVCNISILCTLHEFIWVVINPNLPSCRFWFVLVNNSYFLTVFYIYRTVVIYPLSVSCSFIPFIFRDIFLTVFYMYS